MPNGILIIGAGLAGLTVAEALRADAYEGPITLIGNEAHSPYHRPPLSKGFLLGETAEAQLNMRSPEMLAKKNISLKLDTTVTSIDRAAKKITLSDGSELSYDGLAICTGARLRPLPTAGAQWQGVFGLRSLDDSKAIATALNAAQHLVVIGGGFIGLEVAAAARKKGKTVTILEAADRLMARVVAPLISSFYKNLHEENGTRIVLDAKISELLGTDGRIIAVRTQDGTEYPADALLVGIGIIPNTELAMAAGLDIDGGILVDACGRTSDPAIVVAGDCTSRRMNDGSLRRLESVQNAMEQGKSAAAALLGKEKPFTATPWFWSDQYGLKLQMVGLSSGFDQVVQRGNPTDKKFSVFYYRQGKMIAMDSINQASEHMTGRKLFDKGISPSPEQAADTTNNLNSLLV